MESRSEARYTPYIGKKYSKGINGDHYLFIGGHHHCMISERESKYKCELQEICKGTDDVKCPAYNREEGGCPLYNDCDEEAKKILDYNINPRFNDECRKRIKLTCETRYSVWDYITNHEKRRPNFIFNLIEKFRKELGTDIGEFDFFQFLAFANYLQIITSNERNAPEDPIKEDDLKHEDNWKGFVSNYNYLRPDVIVVIHFEQIKDIIKAKLPNMPNRGESFVELGGNEKYYIFAKKGSNLYKSGKFSFAILQEYSNFIKIARSKYKDNVIASAVAYHNKECNGIMYSESYKELNNKYGFDSWEKLQNDCNKKIKLMKDGRDGKLIDCYNALNKYLREKNLRK